MAQNVVINNVVYQNCGEVDIPKSNCSCHHLWHRCISYIKHQQHNAE